MKHLLLLFTLSLSLAHAQQPNYTLFNQMSSFANPALVGLRYKVNGGLSHQSTVVGFAGYPQVTSAFAEYNSKLLHGGIGINSHILTSGFQSQFQLNLQYAFHIDLGGHKKLSFGTTVGLHSIAYDQQWVGITQSPSSTRLNINAGMAYHSKRFTIGLSSTQITEPTYSFDLWTSQPSRMYHLYSGYNIIVSRKSTIQPSMMVSSDLVFNQANFMLQYVYNNKYWGGVSLIDRNMYGVVAGLRIKQKFSFGAAYHVRASRLSNYNSSSVELLLRYSIPNPSHYKVIVKPNFL